MSNWTRTDFMAYLMLFAANSDLKVTEEEMELIEGSFDAGTIKSVQKEISSDNDIASIDKINAYIKANDCSQEDKERLLTDLLELYNADGKFSRMEQVAFKYIKKIIEG